MMQLLEQVNAQIGELYSIDAANKDALTDNNTSVSSEDSDDDSHIYFSPQQGNVIFASALDGWAFT